MLITRSLFFLYGFILFVTGVFSQDKGVEEWSVPITGQTKALTLYPSEKSPTGVLAVYKDQIILVSGQGKVLWKQTLSENAITPATVADLDGNGKYEILVGLENGSITCFSEKGELLWHKTGNTSSSGFQTIVVADVHPNTGLEILAGFDDGWLRCLTSNGDLLWEFYGDPFRVSSMAVGDANSDGAPEIIYGTENGHVYCVNGWGQIVWRYDEVAPFGRSGINIADLNSDGIREVLLTRSNVGNINRLIALNGANGNLMWATKDFMHGYNSNAIVDFNGDGKNYQVIHTDKGNHIYSENSDGSRHWETEIVAHGIFWAPVVADINGDGRLEVITTSRQPDPKLGGSLTIIDDQGKIIEKIYNAIHANAGAVVGDIDGDGNLEVVYSTQTPDAIRSVSWNRKGRVSWPSMRGNSRMTATAPNVPNGKPFRKAPKPKQLKKINFDTPFFWGDNKLFLTLDDHPEGFIEIEVKAENTPTRTWIYNVRKGKKAVTLPFQISIGGSNQLTIRLMVPESPVPITSWQTTVIPESPSSIGFTELKKLCEEAITVGDAIGADVSGLSMELAQIDITRKKLESLANASNSNKDKIMKEASVLRKKANYLSDLARLLKNKWEKKDAIDFLAWVDDNPWDRFDPKAVPKSDTLNTTINFTAYQKEQEDAVITLFNPGSQPLDVRLVFQKPKTEVSPYQPESELSQAITLHRAVPVAGASSQAIFDALPELDLSRSITLPPGEGRQIWLVLDTHDLEPGSYDLILYAGTMGKALTTLEIPINIKVWNIALPNDVFKKMNWTSSDQNVLSEQSIHDMTRHGINVSYGPAPPSIPVDKTGKVIGKIDWSTFDASLKRLPRPWTLLFSRPPVRKWPNDENPEKKSSEYIKGFKNAVLSLSKHLTSLGFIFDDWAFYPYDEPWLTGFTHVAELKEFAQMVKDTDARVQIYTDPAGNFKPEYLDEFKDLIDIWQPELNSLKRNPELVDWFRKNARHFWFYEAPGPAKEFLPLGHYRAYGWNAWMLGAEGGGYWIYKYNDNWWKNTNNHWAAVYQTNLNVVTSRRWEADRDGVEDYRALYLLDAEIKRIRALGHKEKAEEAKQLIAKAIKDIVDWNWHNVDEITILTKDYEIDWNLVQYYRSAIADKILELRSIK